MPNSIRGRITLFSTTISAIAVAWVATLIFSVYPVAAAPQAQPSVPNFVLNTNTMISVTVAITGGQVIVIPIDLTFVTQNRSGETDVSIIADVEQQPGLFIGVAPAENISATLQFSQAGSTATANGAATTTTSPATTGAGQPGTHVVTNNSNLRAGPGTDFDIVGKAAEGDLVTVVGQNDDGTWYQLDDSNWIAAFLAEPVDEAGGSDSTGAVDAAGEDGDTTTASPTEEAANVPAGISGAIADQAALAVYFLDVAEIGAGVSDAVASLTELMQNPQPLNPQWRNDVTAELAVMSDALDQYLALTPLPGYEDLHTQITDVALTCEQAVDYMITGLENPQDIDPAVASQSIQACAAQATDLAAYLGTLQ